MVTCKQTLVCEPEGKRQHGSKKHRWDDNIKIYVKQTEKAFTTMGSYVDRPYFIKSSNFFTS
jgi:hypothetical protein